MMIIMEKSLEKENVSPDHNDTSKVNFTTFSENFEMFI
jgi:hypothetical protein